MYYSQDKPMLIPEPVLNYLHAVRRSGQINMFTAAQYLVRDLGIDKETAAHYTIAYTMGEFTCVTGKE